MNPGPLSSALVSSLRLAGLLVCLFALGACDDSGTPPKPAQLIEVQARAVASASHLEVSADAIQTSALNEATARKYGIERDDNRILLLVTVRTDTDADDDSLPGPITASVTDLSGQRSEIALRELRIDDPQSQATLIDHIGIVETPLPQTLRFEVRVKRANGATMNLQLSRDFQPQ